VANGIQPREAERRGNAAGKRAAKAVTKLARIVDELNRQIASGQLTEGEQLPSEEQLAAKFGVSVGTLQKALTRLAHQGLIIRRHGRGTFVARTRRAPAELRYLTFRDREGRDLPLYVHVVSVKTVRQRGPWSEFLQKAQAFIRIERMINVGGEFEVFSEFFVPEDEFLALHNLTPKALERTSLREVLREHFSLPTVRAERLIYREHLPERVAALLRAPAETPGLVMELLGYTTHDRPLSYQRLFIGELKAVLVVTQ
jgi:DNA-binding GntR family transcriptional regulator